MTYTQCSVWVQKIQSKLDQLLPFAARIFSLVIMKLLRLCLRYRGQCKSDNLLPRNCKKNGWPTGNWKETRHIGDLNCTIKKVFNKVGLK